MIFLREKFYLKILLPWQNIDSHGHRYSRRTDMKITISTKREDRSMEPPIFHSYTHESEFEYSKNKREASTLTIKLNNKL
jgi:hypothetical protein